MRTTEITAILATLVVTLAAPAARAATLDGTVKLGGVIMNQTGDRTTVQETYNVYDGFSLAEIRLAGSLDSRHAFTLDLRDLNVDSRRGDLVYRVPGTFKLTAGFDQHRQIFAPVGPSSSMRKDWRTAARLTPGALPWLALSGGYDVQTRDGDRLPFPAGTRGALGFSYDHELRSGDVTAEVRHGRRGGAFTYRTSSFRDELAPAADRSGRVLSARLYAPCVFYDRWTHLLRASYGTRHHSDEDREFTMSSLQYTGVIEPLDALRLRYGFDAQRVDDPSVLLKTDRIQNDVDATVFHRHGQLDAGYGYETNDDDRTLTAYHNWRLGAAVRNGKLVSARVDWASRVKKDQEELTLLKDVEASRLRGKLQVRPRDGVVLGGSLARRERELPDLGVTADGDAAGAFGRCEVEGWGAVSADYSFSSDDYRDRAGAFHTDSDFLTGRVEFERVPGLRLAGGVTWMDIGGDLDIEKSVVSLEGAWTLAGAYVLELEFNAFNYDDYVLLDRYYTANVLRINVGYNLHLR